MYDLLLHFDGSDGSTTITDSGGLGQTVTAHAAAQIDTGQAVFAGQALQLVSGDYVSVDSGSFGFGTGAFTIDFRVRMTTTTAQVFYDGGATGLVIKYNGSALQLVSAAGTITGGALSANTNYHIAATRSGTSTRLFLDGTQTGSTLTDSTSYGATSGYPRIGEGATDPLSAWVAAVVSHGGATPSSAMQTAVGNLITSLTSAGIYAKLDRLWLYAGEAHPAEALTDIVVGALASAVGSPGLTSNGYLGASSKYIDSGFDPTTATSPHITTNNACMFAWTNQAAADTGSLFGDGAGGTRMFPAYTDNNMYAGVFASGSTFIMFNPTVTPGLYTVNRITATANAYTADLNGSQVQSVSDTSAGPVNANMVSLAEAANTSETSSRVACFGFGGGLTSTERAALYTHLRTYMTAVGVP